MFQTRALYGTTHEYTLYDYEGRRLSDYVMEGGLYPYFNLGESEPWHIGRIIKAYSYQEAFEYVLTFISLRFPNSYGFIKNLLVSAYLNQVRVDDIPTDEIWQSLFVHFHSERDIDGGLTLWTAPGMAYSGREDAQNSDTYMLSFMLYDFLSHMGSFTLPTRYFIENLYYLLEKTIPITNKNLFLEVAAGNGIVAHGIKKMIADRESRSGRTSPLNSVASQYIASDNFSEKNVANWHDFLLLKNRKTRGVENESAETSVVKNGMAGVILVFCMNRKFLADIAEILKNRSGPLFIIYSALIDNSNNQELDENSLKRAFASLSETHRLAYYELPFTTPVINHETKTLMAYINDKNTPSEVLKEHKQAIQDIMEGLGTIKKLNQKKPALLKHQDEL
ncbi:MAG: hypothetical protein ACR2PT_12720 [Endozoicomonas sp.]